MMNRKKKTVFVSSVLTLLILFINTACEKRQGEMGAGHSASSQTGVESLLQSGLDSVEQEDFVTAPGYTSQTSALPSEDVIISFTTNEEGVEIDLTQLSSGAVYAVVYDMTIRPETYCGKSVKMHGAFATASDEEKGVRYFACIVQDATACCSQGIEFVPRNSSKYPEGFPDVGGECTVTGTFDVYTEGETSYITLRDATLSLD